MAEDLDIIEGTKQEQYDALYPQLESLLEGETDLIANLANVTSALKEMFEFVWVGFYRVQNDELVLGPFQGTVACTRIPRGKGVCGTCWDTAAVQVVPNVDEFPGHIACSSLTRSEIVLPLFHNAEVVAVLDVDSERLNEFDAVDVKELSKICRLLERKWVK
jgi:L-methionine (R)-S-oxide reductase